MKYILMLFVAFSLLGCKERGPVWVDEHGGITTTSWKDQPEWFVVDHEKGTAERYCYGKKC